MASLTNTEKPVPGPNQKIIGFYGTSGQYGMCNEFGIVTGPADQHIPDIVYDMPELQNNPDGGSRRPTKRRRIVSTRANPAYYGIPWQMRMRAVANFLFRIIGSTPVRY